MRGKVVVVLGGSGFVGRHLIRHLAQQGALIKVGVRHPDEGLFLKPMGTVGQIKVSRMNILDEASLKEFMKGADYVVNLVGIIFEKGRQTFKKIHELGAERAAKAAFQAGVTRYIHLSSLAASESSSSKYARSKMAGEKLVQSAFPSAIIVRPSLIFGPEDHFFNRFGRLATISPILPCFGASRKKIQPVYVGDVVHMMAELLESPSPHKIYELGGPHVYSFKELLKLIISITHRKTCVMIFPRPFGYLLGAFGQFLPSPPLTVDQVRLLGEDNIVQSNGVGTFIDLGIQPSSLEPLLPHYLKPYIKL